MKKKITTKSVEIENPISFLNSDYMNLMAKSFKDIMWSQTKALREHTRGYAMLRKVSFELKQQKGCDACDHAYIRASRVEPEVGQNGIILCPYATCPYDDEKHLNLDKISIYLDYVSKKNRLFNEIQQLRIHGNDVPRSLQEEYETTVFLIRKMDEEGDIYELV